MGGKVDFASVGRETRAGDDGGHSGKQSGEGKGGGVGA